MYCDSTMIILNKCICKTYLLKTQLNDIVDFMKDFDRLYTHKKNNLNKISIIISNKVSTINKRAQSQQKRRFLEQQQKEQKALLNQEQTIKKKSHNKNSKEQIVEKNIAIKKELLVELMNKDLWQYTFDETEEQKDVMNFKNALNKQIANLQELSEHSILAEVLDYLNITNIDSIYELNDMISIELLKLNEHKEYLANVSAADKEISKIKYPLQNRSRTNNALLRTLLARKVHYSRSH